jgi:hypothetical protein
MSTPLPTLQVSDSSVDHLGEVDVGVVWWWEDVVVYKLSDVSSYKVSEKFLRIIFINIFYYSSSRSICPYQGDAMEGQVYSELPIFPRWHFVSLI